MRILHCCHVILAVTNFNTILKYAYLYLDLSSKGGEAKENFKGFSEQKPSSFQQQVGFRERCAPAWQWDPSKGTPPHPPHPPLHRAAGTKPSLRRSSSKHKKKRRGSSRQLHMGTRNNSWTPRSLHWHTTCFFKCTNHNSEDAAFGRRLVAECLYKGLKALAEQPQSWGSSVWGLGLLPFRSLLGFPYPDADTFFFNSVISWREIYFFFN